MSDRAAKEARRKRRNAAKRSTSSGKRQPWHDVPILGEFTWGSLAVVLVLLVVACFLKVAFDIDLPKSPRSL